MDEKYLPLGSVVRVKGGVQKFMIISRGVVLNLENKQQMVDYGSCVFPQGVVSDKIIYFNHSDIVEVLYTGYSDDLDQRMVKNIKIAVSENKNIPQMDINEIVNRFKDGGASCIL